MDGKEKHNETNSYTSVPDIYGRMYCLSCGEQIQEHFKYCPECGKKLKFYFLS